MIDRNLETQINKYAGQYPVISIVGPRQSGKTTLSRHVFPDHHYVSLENLDTRHLAEEDPRGFLQDYPAPLIIDEAQRVPHLFSYLQEKVDSSPDPAQYILTGSQQFLLMEGISQSLAGRVITFKLFPLTYNELHNLQTDNDLNQIFAIKTDNRPAPPGRIQDIIFTGMYPRIHDRNLAPRKWLENYVLTYVERDIRRLVNVKNLRIFEDFMKVIASHSGQLINYSALSNTIGVSLPTIKNWISLLETSGIIFILSPHHKRFLKRVVKTPKIFFIDTGLLCFLLSIRSSSDLKNHPLFGNIFETFIISELYKRICHIGEIPPLYFWRDKVGNEIDLLVDFGNQLFPVEIKASRTYSTSFKANITQWLNLKENPQTKGLVLFNGDKAARSQSDIPTVPWWLL
ncbi:MAG: ATP-binding protein [bacterium]|nr:ATP-binding protein [bacterium]